jgi:SNF family Na+-dependent transporter
MGSIETFITSVFDLFPKLKQTNWIRYTTIIVIVAIFFLLGILFTIQSGTYWLEIFNEYSGSWSIFIIAILECISVNWFYGKIFNC